MSTPNDIEVLLHYYVSPDPHPRAHAPAVQETTKQFLKQGVIQLCADGLGGYSVTPRGEAWVKALCAVPAPRRGWISADGTVLSVEDYNEADPPPLPPKGPNQPKQSDRSEQEKTVSSFLELRGLTKFPSCFRMRQEDCWDHLGDVADLSAELEEEGLDGHLQIMGGTRFHGVHGRSSEELLNYGILIREPRNPHDKNACRVYACQVGSRGPVVTYQSVGYLNRGDAAGVAPILDANRESVVRVALSSDFLKMKIRFD